LTINQTEEKKMHPKLNNQSTRVGIAVSAVTFAIFWYGTTQAAPPPDEPTFAKASISIAPRDKEAQEIAAGDLICGFRETGLDPFALISYECKAAAAAVVEGCFFRNKFVPDAGTETTIGLDVSNVEAGHEADVYIANNSGAINGEVVTAIPESPHVPGGGHLCAEPLEVGVVAARWCDTSLTDTTNNLVGATVTELFLEFEPGVPVPSCAEILSAP
jgi:hypothetical protein